MGERRDKFVAGPGELVVSQCRLCRHHPGPQPYPVEVCPAFLGGIPPEILRNEFDHREPYPGGDEGIRWEPRDGASPRVLEALAQHFAEQGRDRGGLQLGHVPED